MPKFFIKKTEDKEKFIVDYREKNDCDSVEIKEDKENWEIIFTCDEDKKIKEESMVDLKNLDIIKLPESEKKAVADSAKNFFDSLENVMSGSIMAKWVEQIKKIIIEINEAFSILKNQVSIETEEMKKKIADLQKLENKMNSLKTDLEAQIKAERSVITQLSNVERKNISDNSKHEKDQIENLLKNAKTEINNLNQEATGKAKEIEKKAKEAYDKIDANLESFKVNNLAVVEKDLKSIEARLEGVAKLLMTKENKA